MSKFLSRALIVVLASGLGAAAAHAATWTALPKLGITQGPTAAPEFDPSVALGALTLLTGGLVVVRGRRSRR